jgi:hypothetical protein
MSFADPSRSFVLLVVIAAVIAGIAAFRTRSRHAVTAFAVFAVMLLAIVLMDRFIESPREEAVRRVEVMTAAAMAGQPDAFVEHVSVKFDKNGVTRDKLRTSQVWELIKHYKPTIKVWDFSRDQFEMLTDDSIQIGFMMKGEAQQGFILRYGKAKFIRDTDGAWRMSSIAFYNPAENGLKNEDPIPGFP